MGSAGDLLAKVRGAQHGRAHRSALRTDLFVSVNELLMKL